METPISDKIVKNTIYNIVGKISVTLIYLVMTPYIINNIGIKNYGIWALISVIASYLGLLDIGVNTSYVKYFTEFYTKKDYKKLNEFLNTGFIIYVIVGIFVLLLGISLMDFICKIFNLSKEITEIKFVILMGIISFVINNIFQEFTALQTGLQRMDVTNKISIIISLLTFIGVIFFLDILNLGLKGLAINSVLISIIAAVVNIIVSYKLLPEMEFLSLYRISIDTAKKMFSYGMRIFASKLENVFTFQTDKLFISYFLNISFVTLYELGSTLINRISQLPLSLISAVSPVITELDTKGEIKKIYELYSRGIKYLAVVLCPLLVFTIFSAPIIMFIWMGKGYEKSVQVIQLLGISYLINYFTPLGVGFLMAIGKVDTIMKIATYQFLTNLVLSLIFIIKFGFIGVVLATFISLSFWSIWFITKFHKIMNFSYSVYKYVFKTSIISLLLCSVIWLFMNRLINVNLLSRLESFALLFLVFIIFFLGYTVFILKTSYFDKYDFSLLIGKLQYFTLKE